MGRRAQERKATELRVFLLKRIGRGDVIAKCARKRKFEHRREALQAYGDETHRVYQCDMCGYWHCSRKGPESER